MIEVKCYSKEFEKAHIQFAEKYWTKKRRLTPEYIYWKFRGNSSQELKSFLLAFNGDVVVGQFGLVPCEVNVEGEIYEGQWACDLMVDTDYRGKGVAEKLYDFAHENKLITLGSDASPAAEKSMIRKGYQSLNGPRKFVYPFKIGEVFKLKGINNSFLNKIPNPFTGLLYLVKKDEFEAISSEDYYTLNSLTVKEEVSCNHNLEFFNWRFSKYKEYYVGINCYKKDDSNFFSGYYVNGIYFLTDFKVSSNINFLKIISFIHAEYSSSNIQRVKFVSNNQKINSIIPFLGFIRFRTITKIILFTKSISLKEKVKDKMFYYTLHDSDENI
ncbi:MULTISPECIES: GNAT family N-acetyltransferase [Flavobacterium]|uniref:GNAT family N-acetyltransferase n=1 Tax=Flavobacterium jumunjinense TaxID=998845 RepID=A0ABV5GJ90_9FLAO|nr:MULTISPECIES: GNAT family N-acetyltransferase [Flavobacterium]